MTNWQRIAREFREYPATMGSFHFHLCECITLADLENTARLKKAYPELVSAMDSYEVDREKARREHDAQEDLPKHEEDRRDYNASAEEAQ